MASNEAFRLHTEIPEDRRLEKELRFAVDFLNANRLSESAKWCSELLSSLKSRKSQNSSMTNSYLQDSVVDPLPGSSPSAESEDMEEEDIPEEIDPSTFTDEICDYPIDANLPFDYNFYERKTRANDAVNTARILFDLREYRKACYKVKPFVKASNQQAIFIYYYSLFMLSEQQTEEERYQSSENISRSCVTNSDMITIENALTEFYSRNELNALNLYLFGVVLKKRNKKEQAKNILVESLAKYPLLWGAWTELNMIIKKEDQELIKDQLPNHWVKNFNIASYLRQVQQENDSIDLNGALRRHFPTSVYILNEIGHACYLGQRYGAALEIFKRLMAIDPHRYEDMDLYSNILYIQENHGDLAALAYRSFKCDKYRPETCCVLGNYYSLRGDHEKAVIYFRRAIKLDSEFLSSWTLMGHEFLELKQTASAIEAYRTAVDIDPNDFRAWYGLGQTYEIHQLYDFASYYFMNAALSRPQDSRMWAALGECYKSNNKAVDASKCYAKAEKLKDTEGIALYKLAKLYVEMVSVIG